jgi:hypothetical protein
MAGLAKDPRIGPGMPSPASPVIVVDAGDDASPITPPDHAAG